jgi:hypothetical protein
MQIHRTWTFDFTDQLVFIKMKLLLPNLPVLVLAYFRLAATLDNPLARPRNNFDTLHTTAMLV